MTDQKLRNTALNLLAGYCLGWAVFLIECIYKPCVFTLRLAEILKYAAAHPGLYSRRAPLADPLIQDSNRLIFVQVLNADGILYCTIGYALAALFFRWPITREVHSEKLT